MTTICLTKRYFNAHFIYLILTTLLLYCTLSYSNDAYLLCGPDEDGCPENSYDECVCIPYNSQKGMMPYCFNFDKFLCTPLSETPTCDPRLVFKDQASCMAINFQSEALPPCPLTTKSFCLEHHTAFCDIDGNRASCHKY
jgi:hypothetical protein